MTHVKELEEVFSHEFIEYMMNQEIASKPDLVLIFRRIEEFEKKNNIQFVCFFGSQYIIFKQG
jgi:hypothetical protein